MLHSWTAAQSMCFCAVCLQRSLILNGLIFPAQLHSRKNTVFLRCICYPRSRKRNLHPTDEDLSVETPNLGYPAYCPHRQSRR